ncbi:structural maintenance of chromosomes protein 5 isoform X2 [Panulirus ornatus]|uniref:structural maintenance of chromosomes protein 5 isoform X2 n=1 Tax=Panulirus ornatus TaxID=150431 RepID=UPI003A85CF69
MERMWLSWRQKYLWKAKTLMSSLRECLTVKRSHTGFYRARRCRKKCHRYRLFTSLGQLKRVCLIETKIASFNIQVDNLCQFLPQDRVANFAKMNCMQLLEATEKAVGDASLSEEHHLLSSSGQRMQELQAELKGLESQLDIASRKNAQLKDRVDNHEIKNQLDEVIKKLQKQQLWFLYDEKRKVYALHKEECDQFQQLMDERLRSVKPARESLHDKKKVWRDMKKLLREKRRHNFVEQLQSRYEQLEESVQDAQREYAAKKEEEEQRERELVDFNRQLDVLSGQLQNLPELNDEMAQKTLLELTQKIYGASQSIAKLESTREEAVMDKKSSERKIAASEWELASIQDVGQQRMELLKKKNHDAYTAALWLKKNRDKFSATVHDPMCTLLNIKDPKFAKHVEGRVSVNDLVSFVCENKDDMNLFKELMDKQKVRVNIIHSTATDLEQFQPPVPIENLRQYGFETYMLDCIDAPPAVLSHLCRSYRIHRIPIAEKGDYGNVPNELTFFYIGGYKFSKVKSRYDGEWSTSIFPLREAELLHITIDTQRIKQLKHVILESRGSITKAEQTLKEVKVEESNLTSRLESWRNEKRVLQSRREEREKLQMRVNQKKNQIERRRLESIDLKALEAKMKADLQEIVKQMVAVTVQRAKAVVTSVEGFKEYIRLSNKAKTAQDHFEAIERQLASAEQEIISLDEAIKMKTMEVEVFKAEAQGALQKLLRALDVRHYRQVSAEIRAEFQNSNLEETERLLAEKEAFRECLITASDSEVQEYQRREAEVRQLHRQLEDAQINAENHQKELEISKTRWLPRITELVENISVSFSQFMARLGCAGEVLLDKGPDENDFSKYGIVIKVRFRDSDRLRELTAQHQSGGERAVSTALYLLALQSQTSVPFRCVDEINQGMDPINERLMLKMLMETVASEGSSQYFFVSPKLLPNMEFNDYVNIMVVFNSQTMLPHRRFKLKKILRRRNELNSKEAC